MIENAEKAKKRKSRKRENNTLKKIKTDCYLNDTTLHVVFGYREQGKP